MSPVDRAWKRHARICRAQARWRHLLNDPRWTLRRLDAWEAFAIAFEADL